MNDKALITVVNTVSILLGVALIGRSAWVRFTAVNAELEEMKAKTAALKAWNEKMAFSSSARAFSDRNEFARKFGNQSAPNADWTL